MKKIILIIGILIGLWISSSAQNNIEHNVNVEEVSMMTNGSLSSEDINTAISNSHVIKYENISSKNPVNKKIEEIFLSLNKNHNDNNIMEVMDSLYNWSVTTDNMSFITQKGNINNHNVNRNYIKYELQYILMLDLENINFEIVSVGQWRLTDTKDPITGEYWRKDYYRLSFDIIENGINKNFCEIDVNKGHIKNIIYWF
jgi:hypothetical protein